MSRAGLLLLRSLADKTGLTGGLSKALATPRLLIHDRGRVLADLVTAIAGGAEVIEARHGAIPGVVAADKKIEGVTCIRLDATVTPAHSDKKEPSPITKGIGRYPLLRIADRRKPGSRPCRTHPDQRRHYPRYRERNPRGLWNPPATGPPAGLAVTPQP